MAHVMMRRKSKRRTKRQMRETALKASRKQLDLDEKAKDFLAAALPGCKKKPVTLTMGYVWDDGRLWLGGNAVERE